MSEMERDPADCPSGPGVIHPVREAQFHPNWESHYQVPPLPARAESSRDRVAWLMSATSLLLLLSVFLPFMVEKMTFAFTRGKQRALYELAGDKLQQVGLQDLSLAYQMIAHRVEPSVVHISVIALPGTTDFAEGDSPWPHPTAGQGSGIIVDPEGYVVTNAHVLFQASQIRVRLSDGRSVPATVVGADRETDMAVLKVSAGNLIAAQWGDSDEIEVGALVWAVGSPMGLQRSVTFGILSGKHRSFTSEPLNGRLSLSGVASGSPYHDFLQTDAAVNPGNSGGPLVDARGRVIGVNTAIIGETYQGISLAIPSSIARPVYERLVRDGRVVRGWLGVLPRDIAYDEAASLKLDSPAGALIVEVRPDSPAQRAGLAVNDVIVRWDGKLVTSRTDLFSRVALTEVGVPVDVVVVRDGQTLTLQVTVVDRPFGSG